MGSPRVRGNTDTLLDSAIEGARQAGAEVDKVLLNDLPGEVCTGFFSCARAAYCVKHPHVNKLIDKLKQSDGIILATSVWWFSVSTSMKAFMDHWICLCDPETWSSRVPGKKVGLIAVCAMPKERGVSDEVLDHMQRICEWLSLKVVDRLPVEGVNMKGEVVNYPDLMERASLLGQRVARACAGEPAMINAHHTDSA